MFDVKTNLLNLRDAWRFLRGCIKSWRLLGQIKADVVFVKGGYVGLPVGLAAHWRNIPLVIHESDARPGLTNRKLAKYARVIATGFPKQIYQEWVGKAVVYTGNPVRESVVKPAKSAATLNLPVKKPRVLIMGGSSGAHAINEAVRRNLAHLSQQASIAHITGQAEYETFRELGKAVISHGHYRCFSFVHDELASLYNWADIIVARAGMNAVTEVAAVAKPLILIPAPQLSDQVKNAEELAREHAALVLKQSDATAQLGDVLEQLFSSKALRTELAKNIKRLYKPKAAAALAHLVIQSGQSK